MLVVIPAGSVNPAASRVVEQPHPRRPRAGEADAGLPMLTCRGASSNPRTRQLRRSETVFAHAAVRRSPHEPQFRQSAPV
jgi:hypothetical protein